MTLQPPDWLKKEPHEWPDDAREFYRLCHDILKRARMREAAGLPAQQFDSKPSGSAVKVTRGKPSRPVTPEQDDSVGES